MAKAFTNEPRVTFNQFNEFFLKKGPDKPCPDCGVTDWRIPTIPPGGNDGPATCALLFDQDGYPETKRFFPVFIAFCGNCGHVKQYAADVVLSWRDANA